MDIDSADADERSFNADEKLLKENETTRRKYEALEASYKQFKLDYDRLDIEYSEKLLIAERREAELIRKHTIELSDSRTEIDYLKNCIETLNAHKSDQLRSETIDALKSQLHLGVQQRQRVEADLDHMTTKYASQEDELLKWRIAFRELENEANAQAAKYASTLETMKKRYHELERGYCRLKRESCDWLQKRADIVISLDCFKASLRCLKDEQVQLMALASSFVGQVQDDLVCTQHKVQRTITDGLSDLLARYKCEMRLRKKYHNELVELRGNIRVLCRIRPSVDIDGNDRKQVVHVDPVDEQSLNVENDQKRYSFEMDRVFGPSISQDDIFSDLRPLLTSCVDGYNVCIFAYGQTGSGKTYTMEGPDDDPGINPKALEALFQEAERRKPNWKFDIRVSMMEIYNETVRDLLASNLKLDVKLSSDGSFEVPGLTDAEVSSIEEVYEILRIGQQNRITAATKLNIASSRSHVILRITVEGRNIAADLVSKARLNLIDLAGSERLKKSEAAGERLKEAQAINKSLAAFGDVIHALKNRRQYIPFRNSKLTHLLQDSLSGDSKTVMVVHVAPNAGSVDETLCSLNFASRIRGLELGQAFKNVRSESHLRSTPTLSSPRPQFQQHDIQKGSTDLTKRL